MADPDLSVSEVVSGLESPTTMAFVGAKDFLVLEKDTGRVRHVKNGVIVGTAIDLAVNSANARGALGIVTHPDFATNHAVYIFWTWKGSGTGPGGLEGTDSSAPSVVPKFGNRVDRFIWNGTALRFDRNIATFVSRNLGGGVKSAQHTGGALVFGADDKLYIFLGDQHLRGQLQNIESGPGPTDTNFTGVILRLNDDGTAPSSNPFFALGGSLGGQEGQNIKKIFAYGMRNSFGLAIDPLSGDLWMQENGDDAFDQINRVTAGSNGRWIQLKGPKARYQQYRDIEVASGELDNPAFLPSQLAPNANEALSRLHELTGSHTLEPALSWKFTPGLAGLGFFSSDALGSAYTGSLFVGDVLTGSLYRLRLNAARTKLVFSDTRLNDEVVDNTAKGDLTESESLIFGSNFGIATDIETGPNGNLVIVSLSDGAVYEISKN